MFWKKNPVIKFYIPDDMNVKPYHPVPADRSIPEWFRKTSKSCPVGKLPEGTHPDKDSTIKTCMPVLDAMTGGYVVKSPVDMKIKAWQDDDDIHFNCEWAKSGMSPHDFINFHGTWQLGKHSLFDKTPPDAVALKLITWFCIETPPGYSILVNNHHNNDHLKDLGIQFMNGIIDSDNYTLEINFPFIFTNLSKNGVLIPQGTPLLQLFPFKREAWSHEIISMIPGDDFSRKRHRDVTALQSMFRGGYRKVFRSVKKFK